MSDQEKTPPPKGLLKPLKKILPGRKDLVEFLHTEIAGSVALFAATVVALVWANISWSTYETFWTLDLSVNLGDLYSKDKDLLGWINSGVMTLFFFVVGLEIKREFVTGRLQEWKAAALPIMAAVGGMIAPAIIYAVLNVGGDGMRGWAIPMATDIAFAVGVLALLGNRVPPGLKAFLLTLAIVDDLGAILVIAIFYTGGIKFVWLIGVAAAVLVTLAMQKAKIHRIIPYVPVGLVAWFCMLNTGVHATLAGVIMGLLTPVIPLNGREFADELIHILHPVSSFLVMPLFALANAGVVLKLATFATFLTIPVSQGIFFGLTIGKFIGIVAFTYIALRLSLGILPDGVNMVHVMGMSLLAGIGFTVSMFISDLSFTTGDPGDAVRLANAKVGILMGSLVSAIVGLLILFFSSGGKRYLDEDDDLEIDPPQNPVTRETIIDDEKASSHSDDSPDETEKDSDDDSPDEDEEKPEADDSSDEPGKGQNN